MANARLQDLPRYFLCVLVFSIVYSPVVSRAALQGFDVVEGKGVEVCEVCLQNLEQQSLEQATCERQYNQALGLQTAQWTELDLRTHLDLFKHVIGLIADGDELAKDPNLAPSLAPKDIDEYLQINHLRRTTMNIDNDGPDEDVLRWITGNCHNKFRGFPTRYMSALLVLSKDHQAQKQMIDRPKSDLLVQHLFKSESRPIGIPGDQMYGVFTYKGRVYFDKWDGGGGTRARRPEEDTLSVYHVINARTERLCQFRLRSHTSR